MNKKTFANALEKWAQMTEQNEHGKRLESIAEFFFVETENDYYADMFALFATINRLHEKHGNLPSHLLEVRMFLKNDLESYLEYEIGDEALEQIKRH